MNKAFRCPLCQSHSIDSYDGPAHTGFCHDCKRRFTRFQEARDLFHRLWTGDRSPENTERKHLWNRLRELLGF